MFKDDDGKISVTLLKQGKTELALRLLFGALGGQGVQQALELRSAILGARSEGQVSSSLAHKK